MKLMLMEYKGKRFRVSERTYEFFSRDYPERASKLKTIKESEEYYNYDKLLQLIEPDNTELKTYLEKKLDYYENYYTDRLMSDAPIEYEDNLDELNGKIKMIKEITSDLLGSKTLKEMRPTL